MRFLSWLSFLIIIYHFLIYPLSLWIIAKFKGRAVLKGDFEPVVTLLVPVYNEEKIIAEKIVNSLSLDYPREKFQLLFASDGSTDNSVEIIREYSDKGITILESSRHLGKAGLLNYAIPKAEGEIVVFSDSSGMLNREAIREMVKNFYDPQVGCVCGMYHIWRRQGSPCDDFEARYLDFEFFVKGLESRSYTTLGGHGALYAIRRDLFSPLEEDIINDDFFISSNIALKGFRTVYEKKARIFDKIKTDLKSEFRRRIRLIIGGWQQIFRLRGLFSLRRPFIVWQFFSHKFLRIIMPFCFLFFILSSLYFYKSFFGFVIFLSFLSLIFLRRFFLIFLLGNLAGIVGAYKFFFKKGKVIW